MTELHNQLRNVLLPWPEGIVLTILHEGNADPADNVIVLTNTRTRRSLEITVRELVRVGRKAVFEVLDGTRDCRVLTYVARIVGYFSFMHVWNPSKIAEAKDRSKGNYVLPEAV